MTQYNSPIAIAISDTAGDAAVQANRMVEAGKLAATLTHGVGFATGSAVAMIETAISQRNAGGDGDVFEQMLIDAISVLHVAILAAREEDGVADEGGGDAPMPLLSVKIVGHQTEQAVAG